ncbi:MAG: pyridoxamine kinase [Planctomycetia bacterium]|nr:pyridoxamine kinase [Planctomycetia bacterium]
MKRILTIQDVSCVGKCSLTVALPIISAAQIEACVLPTAVLSTHTRFQRYTFADLTDEIEPTTDVWKAEGITFDGIYTGYLGSFRQMELIEKLVREFRTENNFFFVDPVLGDGGSLYARFDQKFADRMAELCAYADVISPNLTEASFMLHKPFQEKGHTEAYVRNTLEELAALGPKIVLLKGIDYGDGRVGVATYDSSRNEYSAYFHERIPGAFHGTGDIFASAVVAAITRERSIADAVKIAADFTLDSIRRTVVNPYARNYGVDFESALLDFAKKFL